jgi:hypothetical protein
LPAATSIILGRADPALTGDIHWVELNKIEEGIDSIDGASKHQLNLGALGR